MTVFIPPKLRGVIYAVYALLGLGIGATQVGYSAANLPQPVWLTVALAVFAFLGTGIGYTAASNTPTKNGTAVPTGSTVFEVDDTGAIAVRPAAAFAGLILATTVGVLIVAALLT